MGDDLVGVGAHGDAAELEAGHLALVAPGVAVDVEDAAAEEVAEERGEALALGEVFEVGLEHVLDVGRVGGDGAAEDVDVDGARGRLAQQVRVPVSEVGEVLGPGAREVRPADMAAAPRPPAHEQEHRGERHHEDGQDEEGQPDAPRAPGQLHGVHRSPVSLAALTSRTNGKGESKCRAGSGETTRKNVSFG
uniref:Uncharacterized protein n=1 Tax=Triticum urartu TaxID=4572 RepID=A0A8R7UFK0_TRIUA